MAKNIKIKNRKINYTMKYSGKRIIDKNAIKR